MGVGEVCECGLELVGYVGSRRNVDALYRVLGGQTTRTSLDLVHSGKSKNGWLICKGLQSHFPDRERSFLSLSPCRSVELLKQFGITMAATRYRWMLEVEDQRPF